MRRWTVLGVALVVTVGLMVSGCGKDKKAVTNLQGELAQAQVKVKQLEERQKELLDQANKVGLQHQQERMLLESAMKAMQVRLIHNPLEEFKVEPYAALENGWLILDGERTFTLFGYPEANLVRFYWSDGGPGSKGTLLGEDRNGKDGWSWRGALPVHPVKAFWAEIHYPGNIVAKSAVLPIMSPGK